MNEQTNPPTIEEIQALLTTLTQAIAATLSYLPVEHRPALTALTERTLAMKQSLEGCELTRPQPERKWDPKSGGWTEAR